MDREAITVYQPPHGQKLYVKCTQLRMMQRWGADRWFSEQRPVIDFDPFRRIILVTLPVSDDTSGIALEVINSGQGEPTAASNVKPLARHEG